MLQIRDCVPGAIVECINNSGWPDCYLTLRAIYTIKCPFICHCDGIFRLHIDEHTGCYERSSFRLLPPSRLDVFKEALTKIPSRIPEEVN